MTGSPLVVVGLISGTSMDALDAAVVEIQDDSGEGLRLRLLSYQEVPFGADLRTRVRAQFDPTTSSVSEVCEVNVLLGDAFAHAAEVALATTGVRADLVGSHGQTVWHQVAPGRTRSTLQLGEPSVIAERLQATVVADFRPRDIAAGGQGAPLTGWLDALLAQDEHVSRAVQNIGGIGNVTWLPSRSIGDWRQVLAFDTGPGNVLIDEAVRKVSNGELAYDVDGQLARQGHLDERLLASLMREPYFAVPPPKSTGRELFGAQFLQRVAAPGEWHGQRGRDLVATLTAFTAHSIAAQYRQFLPAFPEEVFLCGGGANNPALVEMLRNSLAPSRVRLYDELGLPSSAREAVCFALLAYESLHGRPNSLPACTGASHATVLGKIVPGPNYHPLLQRLAAASPRPSHQLHLAR